MWYNICYTYVFDAFLHKFKLVFSFPAKMSLDLLLYITKNSTYYFGDKMMEIAHIFENLIVLIFYNLVIKL